MLKNKRTAIPADVVSELRGRAVRPPDTLKQQMYNVKEQTQTTVQLK